jgi:hypothetical protein
MNICLQIPKATVHMLGLVFFQKRNIEPIVLAFVKLCFSLFTKCIMRYQIVLMLLLLNVSRKHSFHLIREIFKTFCATRVYNFSAFLSLA